MELNEYDITTLEKIANKIENTLEITNLYLTIENVKTLRMIIRKIKRDD